MTPFAAWPLLVEDFLRRHNAKGVYALLKRLVARNDRQRFSSLLRVAQAWPFAPIGRRAAEKAKVVMAQMAAGVELQDQAQMSRCVIFKPFVSKREPGMILVKFEGSIADIARLKRFHDLEKEYRICFLPSWYPMYSEGLYYYRERAQRRWYILPSMFFEKKLCADFGGHSRYLPFHSASWVSGTRCPPPPPVAGKDIDILVVANFGRYKRHWKLFQALAALPADLKVVLAGISWQNRTPDSMRAEAAIFGVEERIEIIEGASDNPAFRREGMPTIRELLGRAKIKCALTAKEGAFTGAAEALMAGTPVAMFADAEIGSKSYINDQTGWLLDSHAPLAPQLLQALQESSGRRPQEWAKANISAEVNCAELNALLRREALAEGLEWTTDITAFFNEHFEFFYEDEQAEARFAAEYTRVRETFGLDIVRVNG